MWRMRLLKLLAAQALAVAGDCEELRLAWFRAAERGLDFYSSGTSTGATVAESLASRTESAREAARDAVAAFVQVEEEGPVEEVCGGNASAAARLFWLLLQQKDVGRQRIAEGEALDPNIYLLSEEPWVQLLHGGWPTFAMAALVESEFRDPPNVSLISMRMGRQDPSEGCTEQQEAFFDLSILYAGEGRTVRLSDILYFLRLEVSGDQLVAGGEPGCPAARATAFAALADALQCHWRRPRSQRMHILADVAVHKAQEGALEAFGHGPKAFNELLRGRWPLLSFLARLRPRSGRDSILISWSSREVELGGTNWAQNFALEVFGDHEHVELEEDVECADIYIYRSKVPVNFGGVLIFVDGERSPADTLQEELLERYPASIVVGPLAAGGKAGFFASPAAATSFSARLRHTPMALLEPRRMEPRQRFAAYLVYQCYPHRERFFALLDAKAEAAGLGRVESLSRCGNSPVDAERRSERYGANYYDEAVELYRSFRFAMVFENRLSPRYVTEKIVNAFLSGAIPIYWGSPFVLKMFNPKAFIYVNGFRSFEAAVEYVLEVARDAKALEAYATAPILRNTTAARWPFTWHRDAPKVEGPTLREALASMALQKHSEGQQGSSMAVERRPFEYASLF